MEPVLWLSACRVFSQLCLRDGLLTVCTEQCGSTTRCAVDGGRPTDRPIERMTDCRTRPPPPLAQKRTTLTATDTAAVPPRGQCPQEADSQQVFVNTTTDTETGHFSPLPLLPRVFDYAVSVSCRRIRCGSIVLLTYHTARNEDATELHKSAGLHVRQIENSRTRRPVLTLAAALLSSIAITAAPVPSAVGPA